MPGRSIQVDRTAKKKKKIIHSYKKATAERAKNVVHKKKKKAASPSTTPKEKTVSQAPKQRKKIKKHRRAKSGGGDATRKLEALIMREARNSRSIHSAQNQAEVSIVVPSFKQLCPSTPVHYTYETKKTVRKIVSDGGEVAYVKKGARVRSYERRKSAEDPNVEVKVPKTHKAYVATSKDGEVETPDGFAQHQPVWRAAREIALQQFGEAWKETHADPPPKLSITRGALHALQMALKADQVEMALACARVADSARRKTLMPSDYNVANIMLPLVRVGVKPQ